MQVTSSSLSMGAVHTAADFTQVQERREIRRLPQSAPAQDEVEIIDAKALLAKWLFKMFTGRDVPLASARHFAGYPVSGSTSSVGVSYIRREIHHETESSSFTAAGSVTLESGKTVDFSLRLDMNRDLTEINTATFGTGNMSDPIAVNLDGAGVRLSGKQQAFDLNGDGMDETIATLAAGSAWLAQDLNGNGKVDSGKELLGPASGNGFGELAAMDEDHNGWIDEGDTAYHHLGLWSDGALTSLRDAGIGALAVGSVASPFALKDGLQLLGQVAESGVYLQEDGTPGALQEVDLKA